MRAFEVYLNGEKLCTAGLESGDLHCSVGCSETPNGRGEVGLCVFGLSYSNWDNVRWELRSIGLNDEVRIKIVEVGKVDEFEVLRNASPEDVKHYVRRKAREFGWTIQEPSS